MTPQWTDAGLARLMNDVKKENGMEQIKDGGQPAFPVWELNGDGVAEMTDFGLTAQQYAAIHLRVPDSGTDWLDDMIRKAQRDEFATKAMQGMLAYPGCDQRGSHHNNNTPEGVAAMAYGYADAMLKARGE